MTIEDLKIPGTKLPKIPEWTSFRTCYSPTETKRLTKNMPGLVSFGVFTWYGETYIRADRADYTRDNHYLFKLSTIEHLAKEQGMIKEVKTLPKSFACKNTNQVLWDKYIAWFNEKSGCGVSGILVNGHYGFNNTNNEGDVFTAAENIIKHFDVILSLEEWDEIVNGNKQEKTETMQTITRAQLKAIHDVACSTWKKKIEGYASRNPFGDTIEFTNDEVSEMFRAADPSQEKVLAVIFKKPSKDIDLTQEKVDGLKLFDQFGFGGDSLIAVRNGGLYKNKGFYLNHHYTWEIKVDELNKPVLVPKRK